MNVAADDGDAGSIGEDRFDELHGDSGNGQKIHLTLAHAALSCCAALGLMRPGKRLRCGMPSDVRAAPERALRQLRDLPGPRGWPLLGNTLQVERARIHLDVERWAREFGPLFRMRLGRHDQFVIADHELLDAVMRDRPDGFRRSPYTSRIGAEMGLPQGLFSAEGDEWRKQRRMVMASFAPGQVREYFPSLVKVMLRLQRRWRQAARAGEPIVLQADLMRYTVDAIAGLAFGKDINTLEAGDEVIQQHLDKVLPAIFRRVLSVVPTWRWFKTAADRELDHSIAVINATLRDFVAQARQRLHDEPSLRARPRNLLEAMIASADQPGSGLGDAQVAGNVLTMLLAGEDTTANTLAWMIHLLQRHPATLQRVRDEVRRLAPDPAAYSCESMERLVFLDACASETMRLKPVAPFIALMALRDTVVGDVAVPQGTQIWGVLRHDSVSERHFINPQAFEPQRWLDDAVPALSGAAKRAAMPFGSGPRMCPGRYLALLEMKAAMAMLLASFDIESVDTPDGQPARERMAFTMNPVGLRMRLREAA
jgi:cytochrome P450